MDSPPPLLTLSGRCFPHVHVTRGQVHYIQRELQDQHTGDGDWLSMKEKTNKHTQVVLIILRVASCGSKLNLRIASKTI